MAAHTARFTPGQVLLGWRVSRLLTNASQRREALTLNEMFITGTLMLAFSKMCWTYEGK